MLEHDAWLEELAGAILDGASVDWTSVQSRAEPSHRALLEQFRVLAALTDGRRRAPSGTAHVPGGRAAAGPLLADEPVRDAAVIVDGKYLIEAPLGQGGMGLVYRARHVELNKPFALKLLKPRRWFAREALTRFRVEALALGRLDHPNIVLVTDFGIDPREGPYLVMEYIDGVPLAEYIGQRGPLPLDDALPIFESIASALEHAHRAGILHRDLKPSNVLLFERTDGRRDAKLVDFGIASLRDAQPAASMARAEAEHDAGVPAERSAGASGSRVVGVAPGSAPVARLTVPGALVGTLDYIAPEVVAGAEASTCADIFAFGILVYETLVGRRPFEAASDEPLAARFARTPLAPSRIVASLPRELDGAMLAPLAADSARRPRRAREVVDCLIHARDAAAVRLWRRRELPRRAVVSVAMALGVVWLYGTIERLPLVQALESRLQDLRVASQPLRAPDPRIALISIDEATLAEDSRSLAERADEVGTRLGQVFDVGATAVALDLLLPESWGRSDPFSRVILQHPTRIVLASYSDANGRVSGPESVRGLVTVALGPEHVRRLFAFVNVAADPDGVVRTMRLVYRDRLGQHAYGFAARAAVLSTSGLGPGEPSDARVWIDYSTDWTRFPRVSWKDLPQVLEQHPDRFRDRIVLVGAEFVGSGDVYNTGVRAAAVPREVSGLVLQALTLDTLLSGRRIGTTDPTVVAGGVGVAAAAAAIVLMAARRIGRAVVIVAASGVAWAIASFVLFRWTRELTPIVAPLTIITLAGVTAVLARRALPAHPGHPVRGGH